MTWNLAYDHFTQWIISKHLATFNACVAAMHTRKPRATLRTKEDFGANFKESEVLDISKNAGILHENIKKIMMEKLAKRNIAAHPSLVEITQIQAEDTISDLVNNVILRFQ